jgi:tRNA-2-methylthio-N6-dimethylallyladenosine synthase
MRRIDKIRASRRDISITTDLIVGFPGETERDFQATVELAEYCRYDMAYVFKYSPRPGTPAFDSPDDVSPMAKTARFLELEKVLKQSQFNSLQKELNRTVKVLAEGFSNRTQDILSGHTETHKVVNFEAPKDCLGQIVEVEITECKSNTLFGKMV